MDERVEEFRREAERLKKGRQGGVPPYPERLRELAVRYATERRAKGEKVVRIAQELGISQPTLTAWRRAARGMRLRPVQIKEARPRKTPPVAPAPRAGVTLVTPRGYRVEGLEAGQLGALLKELG